MASNPQMMTGLMAKRSVLFPPIYSPQFCTIIAHNHSYSKLFAVDMSTQTVALGKGYYRRNSAIRCSLSPSDTHQSPFDITVLEHYTQRVSSEVLLVHAVVDDEEDEVLVYKGHSSSLMRATSPDLEDAVLPPTAIVKRIDRIKGPYNPSDPKYIQEGLTWDEFLSLVKSRGM